MIVSLFRSLVEARRRTIPCGECFRWANTYVIDHPNAIVFHGTVEAPFSKPPKRYAHAWVEDRGKVLDWQIMVAHHGGKWRGKGYPREVFYELYSPKVSSSYTSTEATRSFVQHGHHGPWD
ncbi:MAG: hypothetical protein ACXABY_00455 [Candidatus Thorarchaeota archaeon]|jgi:hypothetical protein